MARALTALAVFNFLAPAMAIELGNAAGDYTYAVMAMIGAIAGEVLLLAIWAVLGPSPFWRRWLGALVALAGLYTALLAGIATDHVFREDLYVYSANVLLLPLLFLCAQVPLWFLRLGLGRGLRHEEAVGDAHGGGAQFRTRDLLTALALTAVALGLARLTVMLHEVNGREGGAAALWVNVASTCALLAAWGALVSTPSVWAAFWVRRRGAASLAVASVVLVVAGASAAVLRLVQLGSLADILMTLVTFHAGLLAVTLGGCQVIRGWGYSLSHGSAIKSELEKNRV